MGRAVLGGPGGRTHRRDEEGGRKGAHLQEGGGRKEGGREGGRDRGATHAASPLPYTQRALPLPLLTRSGLTEGLAEGPAVGVAILRLVPVYTPVRSRRTRSPIRSRRTAE
jgi:hypothetical protein